MEGHNPDAVIAIDRLVKKFGEKVVLNEFTVDLKRGENLVVLGRSGSGKSVLIKCVIGLMRPESGTINVLGEDVLSLDHDGLDNIRSRVGFLFQSNALYDSMTVKQNLEFPMRRHLKNIDYKESMDRIMDALENVGLAHTLNMMPSELSGGMQKRIALARTLILNPEIILYDEPTTGLDPITGKEITLLMKEIQEKYKTSSIIISHDMKCVKRAADRIAVLVNGSCYAVDTYDNLKRSSDPNINQFFE
ncbi:MAG: ATP-binding cassette domain-containing protein [Chitinophagaceae bacterium]|nr:ATP-binding cassette domain-containing protein [Chitinophagaceae bacterium]